MSIFSSIRFLDDNKEIVISENGKLPELDGSLLKNIKKLDVNSYENVGKLVFTNARLNADSTDGDVINIDTSMNVENESIDNLGNPLILRGNFIGNSENTVLLYTGDNTETITNNITTLTNIALNKDYLGDVTSYNTSNILTYDNVPPIYGQNSEGHKSFGMDIYDKDMTIQYTNKFSEYVKVSYWYYISSTATIRASVYFGLGSRNGAYYMGVFYYDVAYKKLRFFTRSDTLSISFDSLEKDKWHYVELCFKLNANNKAKVYHDGIFLGEGTSTTGSWNNNDGQILFRSITKDAFNFDQLMVNISSEEEYNNFENTEHPIPTSASEVIKSTSFVINDIDTVPEDGKLFIKSKNQTYTISPSLIGGGSSSLNVNEYQNINTLSFPNAIVSQDAENTKKLIVKTQNIFKVLEFPSADMINNSIYVLASGETKAYFENEWINISPEIVETIDESATNNNIPTTKAVKDYTDNSISGLVKSVNGTTPDSSGNVTITSEVDLSNYSTEGAINLTSFGKTTISSDGGIRLQYMGNYVDFSSPDTLEISGLQTSIDANVASINLGQKQRTRITMSGYELLFNVDDPTSSIKLNNNLLNTAGGLAYVESTGKLPISIIPDISSSSTISIGNGLTGDGTESNPLKLDLSNYSVDTEINILSSGANGSISIKKGSNGLEINDRISLITDSVSFTLEGPDVEFNGNPRNTAGGFAVVQEDGKLPSSIIPEQSLLDATNNSKGIVQIGSGINVSDGIISVNKNSIGLNNVDNTSDLDKPISNATKDSLNNKLEANNILEGSNISLSKSGNNITINSNYDIANGSLNGLMSNTDKLKLDGIQNNAEVNVINSIQVNGISQPISDKTVNILVPDSSIFATKTELNNYLPLSGGSLSGSLIFNNSFYLNTNPANNFNYVINTNVNQNQSQLVLTINNNSSQNGYTEWFFRDNTYTRYRHELNGGNGILTQFDLVSGENKNDKTSYANFNCKVISQNEFISNAIQSYRIIYGEYGTFWRQDGTDIYLMITNANDQYGTFNDLRPFCITLSTGQVILNNSLIVTNDENKYVTISDNLGITNNSIFTNSSMNVGQDLIANGRITSKTNFLHQNDNIDISTILNDEARIVPFLVNDKNGNSFFYSEVVLNGTNSIMGQLVVQSRDREKYPAISIGINESNNPYVKSNVPTIGENDDLARCDWIKNNFISVNGGIFSGELINTNNYSSYRIVNGSYGTFWRNDGSSLYLMITNANDPYGTYNDFRPFRVIFSDGQVILNNSFIINSDGYTSIAGNVAISNTGITTNTGISVNGIIQCQNINCQNIVNTKTYFKKTSTTLNKNNIYAQNTYDNNLIFTDSVNRTLFRIDTFLGPTNNTGARLLTQSRDSSVEAELALRWNENNTPAITWSYPTNGANNELARCDWVKNQINSIIGQDVITVYSGKTGILNNDGTDTSWLQILFKKSGNSGIIYGSAQLSREACVNLRNNRPDLTNAHPIALSTKLYGYLPLTYTNNASELLTLTLPYYYDSSASKHSDLETHTRTFVFGLSSDGNFLMSSPEFNGTNIASNDIIFIQFIGLCHV